MKKKSIGFTLIELLIAVAIIGMLLSVIMVSFGNARIRSRDAKRLSDINQMKTGLDLFFVHGGGYPDIVAWNSGALSCLATQIMQVPKDPLLGVAYSYNTQQATVGCGGAPLWKDYYIEVATEAKTEIGPPGVYYLSPKGLTTVAPF